MQRKSSPFAALLADLKGVCDELGLGWYLFGAQAALLYGSARLTADVDVTVALGSVTAERFTEHLSAAGFALRVKDQAFVRATRVLPLVHESTGIPADVVLAGPGLEELFLGRALLLDVGGTRIPVARAEDIVVMKILAGREKDRADVTAIRAARAATFDAHSVRTTLGMLEEALGQSDLLPLFEELLGAHTGDRF